MTVMTKIASWRKPKTRSAAPAPTGSDRQAAIDRLSEIDADRPQVDELQKIADKARSERDKAKAALAKASAAYGTAQRHASSLGASLDSRAVRQRTILRRTSSPLIAEFVETLSALLRDLRNDGVLTSSPPSGEYRVDGHPRKQPWSTGESAGRRAIALVTAIRTAEAMRFAPTPEAEVEVELGRLYDALPQVTYLKC